MNARELFDVSGRVALVTGAASGLGLAVAEILAEGGAHVSLLDVDRAALEAVAVRLRQAGHDVDPVVQDVSDPGLRRAVDAIARTRGRLDIVFANAGVSAGPSYATEAGAIENISPGSWDQVLKVNLTGVFATLQAAARHMKAQRSGRIVVTSSIAGIKADPMVGYAYAATKAALNNLVRQAALELAPYRVLVNAIAPGPFHTNIAGGRMRRDPEAVKAFEKRVPLGRVANTEEIKGIALFLASDACSYVTGTVIPVDGGASAA